MRIVVALGVCALVSGCATVIRGTTDEVGFNSTPSGAEVHTSNGLGCVTPCTLTIKKNEEFVATFQKAGYAPQEIPVSRHIVGEGVAATAGNIIAGGLIGVGVDAVTGAGYEHIPNPVNVVLVPNKPAGPPVAGEKPDKARKPATVAAPKPAHPNT